MIVFFLCGLCRSYKSALFLASSVLRNCGCALNVVYRESEMSEKDFADLKNRLKIIFEADPSQYHNDHSLRRYLKAFKTVDEAFQAILKTNKWRNEYNLASLTEDQPNIKANITLNKARVLRHRDMQGRPVIYIPAKNHDISTREIEALTQFIVYCLVCCRFQKFMTFLMVGSCFRRRPQKNALKMSLTTFALYLTSKISPWPVWIIHWSRISFGCWVVTIRRGLAFAWCITLPLSSLAAGPSSRDGLMKIPHLKSLL